MRSLKRAALFAALSIACLAPMTGVIGTTAVTANDVPEEVEALVPQAVMSAALAEERASPDTLYIPALPESGTSARSGLDGDDADRGASLESLVARHTGVETQGREHECLAGAVYFEAKSESLKGQLAVAEVILNRAQSGRFPGSVCGVVFQPSQFSFVRGGGFPPIARSSSQWRTAVAIATIAQRDMADSGVGKALFFHARTVSPGWRLQRVAAVGNHVFYR